MTEPQQSTETVALAHDVLALAQLGGMPGSYWLTDSRIARACAVLGITASEAREQDWTDSTEEQR